MRLTKKDMSSYRKVQSLVNADSEGLYNFLVEYHKKNKDDQNELFLCLLAYARVCTVELDRLGVMVKA